MLRHPFWVMSVPKHFNGCLQWLFVFTWSLLTRITWKLFPQAYPANHRLCSNRLVPSPSAGPPSAPVTRHPSHNPGLPPRSSTTHQAFQTADAAPGKTGLLIMVAIQGGGFLKYQKGRTKTTQFWKDFFLWGEGGGEFNTLQVVGIVFCRKWGRLFVIRDFALNGFGNWVFKGFQQFMETSIVVATQPHISNKVDGILRSNFYWVLSHSISSCELGVSEIQIYIYVKKGNCKQLLLIAKICWFLIELSHKVALLLLVARFCWKVLVGVWLFNQKQAITSLLLILLPSPDDGSKAADWTVRYAGSLRLASQQLGHTPHETNKVFSSMTVVIQSWNW